ncbi:MAG: tRNA 4-thiouridine(8) synthase ThiI [bacterium]
MTTEKKISALVMMSGGLDSMLAAAVLKAQGIQVTGLCFESPFFSADKARAAAALLGIPLMVEEFTHELIPIIEHPKHGFGSCINPCIDCHAAMINHAGKIIERDGFNFIATGEVLNQRPMSQTKRTLNIVSEESGYGNRLLRPLSAKLLPETEAERLGWVDRSRLLDLNGRSRKPQQKLAEQYGITEYPPSAGGCKLTEPHFAGRVHDLRRNGQLRDLRAVELLKIGRHFRLASTVKVIVGREAAENDQLEAMALPGEVLLNVEVIPGPTTLITGTATEAIILEAARLCARYSDARTNPEVIINIRSATGPRQLHVAPASDLDIERLMI